MTPKWCCRLVLISVVLRVMGGCWVAFVALEYTRYYVWTQVPLSIISTFSSPPLSHWLVSSKANCVAFRWCSDPDRAGHPHTLICSQSLKQVMNDLAELDLLRVLTGSPQFAVQAFLFPFLGVGASACEDFGQKTGLPCHGDN